MLLTGRIFFITTHVQPSALPLTPTENDTILLAGSDARDNRKFALLGYLMMPTHLHLLLAPTQSDTLSAMLREIKITASKRIHAARKTADFGSHALSIASFAAAQFSKKHCSTFTSIL